MSSILDEVVRMYQEANGKYDGTAQIINESDVVKSTRAEWLLFIFVLVVQALTLTGFGYLLWLIWVRS